MLASQSTDSHEIAALERRLMDASERLSELVPSVAKARCVREYDTDRRKTALAHATLPFLEAGESVSSAETKGRASRAYTDAMRQLRAELHEAELAVAQWQACQAAFEAARSVLSLAKTLSNMS